MGGAGSDTAEGPAPLLQAASLRVVAPPTLQSADSQVQSPVGEAAADPAPWEAPPPGPPLPLWRGGARREAGSAGGSHFPAAGSIYDWAGGRRMEVALSVTTFYLVSSPVAATTMDPEPVSRAEGGEAVAASGAAAAAAFRESERQVGEAEAGRAQPPLCLVCLLPFWPAGLPPSRPPPGGAFRGSSSVPRLCLEEGTAHQPLLWQRRGLSGGLGFLGVIFQFRVCKREKAGVSPKGGLRGWNPGDGGFNHLSLVQASDLASGLFLSNKK